MELVWLEGLVPTELGLQSKLDHGIVVRVEYKDAWTTCLP